MNKAKAPQTRGFTLVELLVVIVIIATLAALVYTTANRALRSARATKDVSNLRQCGQALFVYASDLGYFPMGYNWSNGLSWTDLVLRDNVGGNSKTTQLEIFQSPLLKQKIPPTLNQGAVTHFSVNPYLMSDSGAMDPQTGVPAPKWILRPHQLTRPAEQLLVCAIPPQYPTISYKAGHSIAWGLRNMAGGGYPADGTVPQSPANEGQRPIGLTADLKKADALGTLPDFHRYGTGKGQFMFVDGHIESLLPTQVKQKHLAVSY